MTALRRCAIRAAKARVLPAGRGRAAQIGIGRVLREGSTVALLSLGGRLPECLKAADLLAAMGLPTTVADARFAKPLDRDLVRQLAHHHEVLVTVEEGAIGGIWQPRDAVPER